MDLVDLKCRKYDQYEAALIAQQREFKATNAGRRGRGVVLYPPELSPPKPFDEWLEEIVVLRNAENPELVESDVLALLKQPLELATKYRSMWAFG